MITIRNRIPLFSFLITKYISGDTTIKNRSTLTNHNALYLPKKISHIAVKISIFTLGIFTIFLKGTIFVKTAYKLQEIAFQIM